MWSQIKYFKDSTWKQTAIPKTYLLLENKKPKQHSLEELPPMNPASRNVDYRFFKGDLNLFKQQQQQIGAGAEDIPSMTPIDRLIVQEYIEDTLYFFNPSHKECVKQLLLRVPVKFNCDYALIDFILSQLFLLPSPPFKMVYYGVILVDLCRAEPRITTVVSDRLLPLFSCYFI